MILTTREASRGFGRRGRAETLSLLPDRRHRPAVLAMLLVMAVAIKAGVSSVLTTSVQHRGVADHPHYGTTTSVAPRRHNAPAPTPTTTGAADRDCIADRCGCRHRRPLLPLGESTGTTKTGATVAYCFRRCKAPTPHGR